MIYTIIPLTKRGFIDIIIFAVQCIASLPCKRQGLLNKVHKEVNNNAEIRINGCNQHKTG